MNLGISTYTYGWAVGVPGQMPDAPMDEHALLDRAQEFGLPVVQIGDNLPLHMFSDARLGRLATRAAQDGITLEIGARPLTPGRIAEYLALAHRLKSSLIRFIIDGPDHHPTPDEVVRILQEALPLLGDTILALENHDRFPAAVLRRIVEAVDDPRVGICLDTANSLGAGEGLETILDELAPHTANLHLKNVAIERLPHLMGFQVTGRPAGGGLLDLPAVIERIRAHGRCRNAILELWTPPEPTLAATIPKEAAWARESVEFLRPVFTTL